MINEVEPFEIIFVEDNEFDADLTMRALKSYNIANKIHRFSDAQEAINFLLLPASEEETKMQLKLILLDLKLPGMNGLEFLQVIKGNLQTKDIPVVVLTSSTQDEDIQKCYSLGVNSFVSKPVKYEDFLQTVQHLGLYWLLINKTAINGSSKISAEN